MISYEQFLDWKEYVHDDEWHVPFDSNDIDRLDYFASNLAFLIDYYSNKKEVTTLDDLSFCLPCVSYDLRDEIETVKSLYDKNRAHREEMLTKEGGER